MKTSDKNYRTLVGKAEYAFSEKRYLEAFLLQSCLFESVIKDYAQQSLKSVFESHPDLQAKSHNFEIARLVDELYIAGKINKELYANLNTYRKKRNLVIHKILNFDDVKEFEKELKLTYRSGLHMKVFLVDEMIERRRGKTTAEAGAMLERALADVMPEVNEAANRFIKKSLRDLNRNIKKISK